MAYADPETIAIDWLRANVFTGTGDNRVLVVDGGLDAVRNKQHAARFVTVDKLLSSPGDATPTLDIADLEINYFARNRDRARALATTAHPALRYLLPKYTHPGTGAFVKQVRVFSGPAEAPWESRDTARYLASYRLWIHHNPLA